MKSLACIPIKRRSERVPAKNRRPFRGRPLFAWIMDHAREADAFDQVVVDTDDEVVADYARGLGLQVIPRPPSLAEDGANGNDLAAYWWGLWGPYFDAYFQLYATAPTLRPDTIRHCVQRLANTPEADSILTCTNAAGWYWFRGQPVNFRPAILPRSQDAPTLVKETTGLYGIRESALARFRARTGARPIFHQVAADEAVDLDTLTDFEQAEGQRRCTNGRELPA